MIRKIFISTLLAVAVTAAASAQEGAKPTRRQKFDRGLAFDTRTPSMPKGLWVAGINVSYSQQANNDYRIFIINDMDLESNSLNLSPMVHYVFANNQSIGMRFTYKRNFLDIQSLGFNLTPELNTMLFGENGVRYRFQNHTYMGYASYRYYVGLGHNKRFIIFNEVQAGFGGGQQKELTGWNDDKTGYKTGTYQKTFNFRLGISPGATFFVTNVLAVEVQLGLLGYEFKKVTQFGTDLDEKVTRKASNISTRFDFLSIAFGTAFYL